MVKLITVQRFKDEIKRLQNYVSLAESNYKKKERLLVPYEASSMEVYTVSSEVNSPKNNHKGLLNSL